MGAGTSIPASLNAAVTKELAGEKWDQARFDKLQRNGVITSELFLKIAAEEAILKSSSCLGTIHSSPRRRGTAIKFQHEDDSPKTVIGFPGIAEESGNGGFVHETPKQPASSRKVSTRRQSIVGTPMNRARASVITTSISSGGTIKEEAMPNTWASFAAQAPASPKGFDSWLDFMLSLFSAKVHWCDGNYYLQQCHSYTHARAPVCA